MFLEYLNRWVQENGNLINENKLRLEHVIDHGGKKIELGISNIVNNNGGSFELLDDGTCDILIIDYKTDESIFFDTIHLSNIDELKDVIESFIFKLIGG